MDQLYQAAFLPPLRADQRPGAALGRGILPACAGGRMAGCAPATRHPRAALSTPYLHPHLARGNTPEAEKARADRVHSAASLLPQVSEKIGLDRRRTEAEVGRVWNHLIDPVVTAHAQPTGLRKGTLFVSVDNNVWLSEIVRYRRKEILQRLQTAFSSDLIARISFRIG